MDQVEELPVPIVEPLAPWHSLVWDHSTELTAVVACCAVHAALEASRNRD